MVVKNKPNGSPFRPGLPWTRHTKTCCGFHDLSATKFTDGRVRKVASETFIRRITEIRRGSTLMRSDHDKHSECTH